MNSLCENLNFFRICGAVPAHKTFFYRGLSKFCSRGAKVFHARKTKWFPKRNVMLLLNLSGGSEKNTGFLVGAKNNEKQCLFDETSCSSFCLMVPSGRTRASPPSQKGHRPRRVFFSSRRKPPQRSGAREKVSGRPFFPIGLFIRWKNPTEEARIGSMKKIIFGVGPRGEKNDGCFSRIYGIPFGEKGSRLKPETFWSGTEEKTRGGRCPFWEGGLVRPDGTIK